MGSLGGRYQRFTRKDEKDGNNIGWMVMKEGEMEKKDRRTGGRMELKKDKRSKGKGS